MLSLLILSNLLACNGCSCGKGDQNVPPVEPEFPNNWGKWLALDHCTTGEPVIAYYDASYGGLGLAIGKISDDGVKWTHQEIDGYPNEQGLDEGNRGLYASIAIDSADRIWISYYDKDLEYLRYATKAREEDEWTVGLADSGSGSSGHAGRWSSMALDDAEQPVIAHYDVNAASLRVVHSDGAGGFTAEVVDEGTDYTAEEEVIPANVGEYATITIDNGVEYIAYYDRAAGDLRLASGTSGNYSLEIIDSEGNVGQWPSILVSDGTVHITYHDVDNNKLKLASGQPGSWRFEVIDQGEAIGADSFVLSTESGLKIAYHDAYNNDVKLAEQNADGGWNIQTLAGVDQALGFHNALVEIKGTVYAASYDFGAERVWFSSIE